MIDSDYQLHVKQDYVVMDLVTSRNVTSEIRWERGECNGWIEFISQRGNDVVVNTQHHTMTLLFDCIFVCVGSDVYRLTNDVVEKMGNRGWITTHKSPFSCTMTSLVWKTTTICKIDTADYMLMNLLYSYDRNGTIEIPGASKLQRYYIFLCLQHGIVSDVIGYILYLMDLIEERSRMRKKLLSDLQKSTKADADLGRNVLYKTVPHSARDVVYQGRGLAL